MHPSSPLAISLFGSFLVAADGVARNGFESQKSRALLAYLIVESDRAHSRATLATLFWPDLSPDVARKNLRQALYNLRQVLGEGVVLSSNRPDVQINRAGGHEVDVWAFTAWVDRVKMHNHRQSELCPDCREHLHRAARLYRGEFLAGLSLPDTDEFEMWLQSRRNHYRAEVMRALDDLAAHYERVRAFDLAQECLQQQLGIEPWREQSHQGLMRLFYQQGRAGAALRQYEVLKLVLHQEMNVAPSTDSDLLADLVRTHGIQPQTLGDSNPYVGLNAFSEANAADFFGREKVVDDLMALVRAQALVVLMGASGSGKSSIIQAGLSRRLRGRNGMAPNGAEQWRIATFRPGAEPFLALAETLTPLGTLALPASEIAPLLRRDATALRRLLGAARQPGTAKTEQVERTLLVVDAFEELFTLCPDAEARRAFVDLLAGDAAAEPDGVKLTILLSLRADFAGEALAFRALADQFQHNSLVLGPMNREELETAITMPARVRGVLYEAGLVQRLLDEVGNEPGNLPLLQFALTLLWEGHTGGVLTHALYDRLGGVRGALAGYAEQVFERLSLYDRKRMQQIFLRAVRPGEGTPDTRRLLLADEVSAEDWRLVQRLATERLLVTNRDAGGRETAELAHESMIHHWGRLQNWLENDYRFRFWHTRLRAAVDQWQHARRDSGGLLRGSALAEAETWLEARGEELTEAEKAFILAGVDHRDRLEKEVEERRRLELAQAQALAAAERARAELAARSRRRLRWVAAALAISLGLGLAAAVMAYQQAQEATRQAVKAQARQLSAQAQNLAATELDTALLLAQESARLNAAPGDVGELLLGFDYSPLVSTILHGDAAPMHSVAFLAGSRDHVVASAEGATRVWDLTAGREAKTLFETESGSFSFAWLSPDGRRAAAIEGAEVILWDVETGAAEKRLSEHVDTVDFLSFSGDGSRLVTGSVDGALILRDADTGAPLSQFVYDGSGGMALMANGERLAMFDEFDDRMGIEIWDMQLGERVSGPFFGHDGTIHSITASPDGLLLATTGFDKTVRLWHGLTGEPLAAPLIGHSARVLSAAFSPDSKLLATGGADNKIILWDVASRQALGSPLAGHGNWVRALAFSADGQRLASADAEGKVFIWDLSKRQVLRGHTDRVRVVAFSPDGREALTSSFDATLRAWDAASGQPTGEFPAGHEAAITAIAYSPDGRTIASADADGVLLLWDAVTRQLRTPPLLAHEDLIISLAFTPAGDRLASGDFAGLIHLWDVATGRRLQAATQAHANAWTLALAFSPDGTLLASGGTDSNIALWRAAKTTEAAETPLESAGEPLTGHQNWVTSLLFSADGSQLISASSDQTIRLWDVASGAAVAEPLVGHEAQVWGVQFYPPHGGKMLVSLGGDGSILWWDMATRQPLLPPLHTHTETESFAISADGSRLLIGTLDATAQLWQIDARPWPEQACSIARRVLNEAEWQRFMGETPYDPACRY